MQTNVESGSTSCVKSLLQCGAITPIKTSDYDRFARATGRQLVVGISALELAQKKGYYEIAKLIREARKAAPISSHTRLTRFIPHTAIESMNQGRQLFRRSTS